MMYKCIYYSWTYKSQLGLNSRERLMDYKGMRYRTFKKFIHPINMCNAIDHLDLDRQIKFINLIMHWNIRTAYYRGMVVFFFVFFLDCCFRIKVYRLKFS